MDKVAKMISGRVHARVFSRGCNAVTASLASRSAATRAFGFHTSTTACTQCRSFSSKMHFGHDGKEGSTETIMMDLCLVPLGMLSVSKEIAVVEKILRDPKYGLTVELHAYGSNIQGEWDNVMAAMKECHRVLHNEHGIARITSSIRMGSRIDKTQTIAEKVASVVNKM